MKAQSAGKTKRGLVSTRHLWRGGFSTLELMIAFGLISLVMGGVILATFSAQYWAIASETSNEALYIAKTHLEELRSLAGENFNEVEGSGLERVDDETCEQGGLCYFIEERVTDISSCSKYAEVLVSSKVPGYPTTTVSLFTTLTNAKEAISAGGDCLLQIPKGEWDDVDTVHSYTLSQTPSAIDVLGEKAYLGLSESPYLGIGTEDGISGFTNGFTLEDPVNDIDVARNTATGRVYAYLAIASTSNQLQIVDVTEEDEPVLVASAPLPGVSGDEPEGWRIAKYDHTVYITTLRTDGPEFHIFDVGTPESPIHRASLELNSSVYGIALREEEGEMLAYMVTSHPDREVVVFNMSDAFDPQEILGARTNISGNTKAGRSIALHGTRLFVGLQSGGGHDLYELDASNSLDASGGFSTLSSVETSPRSVTKLKVSGGFLFIAGINATPEIQIRSTEDLSLIKRVSVQGLVESGIDLDGDSLYAISENTPHLRVFRSE